MTQLPSWWPSDKPWIIADCLEVMKQMPDKCVDLVLTDPPYGLNEPYGVYDDTPENLVELVGLFMPEVLRISKVAAITPGVHNIHLYPKPRWILCWNYNPGHSIGGWGWSCWQPILVYGTDPYLTNCMGFRGDMIVDRQHKNFTSHPCEKSEGVWTKILNRCSVMQTDIVFDPFLGSGTTLLACRKTGRIGLGCEINPEYEEIIAKRSMSKIPALEGYFADEGAEA